MSSPDGNHVKSFLLLKVLLGHEHICSLPNCFVFFVVFFIFVIRQIFYCLSNNYTNQKIFVKTEQTVMFNINNLVTENAEFLQFSHIMCFYHLKSYLFIDSIVISSWQKNHKDIYDIIIAKNIHCLMFIFPSIISYLCKINIRW